MHPVPAGSFAWRVSCYEQFGWTPDECKRVFRDYPQESDLLSVYFEELSAFRGEEYARIVKQQNSYDEPGWKTDLVLDDEEDED